mmetsp:Transcript_14486/g.26800  ORF Transcript_14486/g.26800 Transcript_14486/m.26800 type:complete len:118 (+) Transcript_14486:915-1268(+)
MPFSQLCLPSLEARPFRGWCYPYILFPGRFACLRVTACAAAIQNMMLSLASNGVGSKWMTGAMGISPSSLLSLVNADPNSEHLMGVIFVGIPATPTNSMKVPKRKNGLGGGILEFVE